MGETSVSETSVGETSEGETSEGETSVGETSEGKTSEGETSGQQRAINREEGEADRDRRLHTGRSRSGAGRRPFINNSLLCSRLPISGYDRLNMKTHKFTNSSNFSTVS